MPTATDTGTDVRDRAAGSANGHLADRPRASIRTGPTVAERGARPQPRRPPQHQSGDRPTQAPGARVLWQRGQCVILDDVNLYNMSKFKYPLKSEKLDDSRDRD